MPIKKTHGGRALVAAVLALAALPGAASAAAAEPTACPLPALSQPFEALGDLNSYFLATGGDFETPGVWTVSGAHEYRQGERPGEYAGEQALRLEAGASATSPAICVDDTYPHLRLAGNAAGGGAELTVEAVREDGTPVALDTLSGSEFSSWGYSRFVPLASKVGLTTGHAMQLRLRLTAVGGQWGVDAVAVDPRKGG